jgi:elongation factor P
MLGIQEVEKGMILNINSIPHLVVDREFYKPGKGSAVYRVKLKDIKGEKILHQTYRSGDKVEEVQVDTNTMQFLYLDGEDAYFMNPETFEQSSIGLEKIPGRKDYLHTEGKYIFITYEDEVLSVRIPLKITLEVVDTKDVDPGNTANNATKEAELETGLKVQVPLFMKTGDRIDVNTESGSYVSKVN